MKGEIIVPEGMLEAAQAAGRVSSWSSVAMISAALLWLSENPIVPTREQADKIRLQLHPETESGWTTFSSDDCEVFCGIWQRRMFLAPEPNPVVIGIVGSLQGTTLSVEDAEVIFRALSHAVPGWKHREGGA